MLDEFESHFDHTLLLCESRKIAKGHCSEFRLPVFELELPQRYRRSVGTPQIAQINRIPDAVFP